MAKRLAQMLAELSAKRRTTVEARARELAPLKDLPRRPNKRGKALMERLEDLELNAVADARKEQAIIKVGLDEL